MQKLGYGNLCVIGFTLFSMFFGAGNLIFPPLLGTQAGSSTPAALLGLLITAVCFPILAVIAVARHGGLKTLAGYIHPKFALVFTVLVYLLIGPCVAIPRTASTSFEMAAAPFLQVDIDTLSWLRIIYSILFFAAALLVARKPTRLKDLLGRIMTPILLVLIAILFLGVLLRLPADIAAPRADYDSAAFLSGFTVGYQTMDILAALNFGIIISLNIEALGLHDSKSIARETMKAGGVAGLMLAIVYAATAYIGTICSARLPEVQNGAEVLTYAVHACFGIYGQVLMGVIFFIACFNVCVGLLCCCSEYFHELLPAISYQKWLFGFAGFSFIVSSAGLNFILEFSLPILSVMSPIAIGITLFGLIKRNHG